MALAPISRLRKQDIIWLSKNYCKHKHTYLAHYNCYIADNPRNEKIGFLDIETYSFYANKGLVLCWVIRVANKNYFDVIKKEDLLNRKIRDKNVVRSCVERIKNLDRLVTYWGSGFDIPFLRTRALFHNVNFPNFGEINHTDVYYMVRNKLKLERNKLENACLMVLGKTRKSKFSYEVWFNALYGDKKSLQKILGHCKGDVLDLKDLHDKILNYSAATNRSI